MATQTHTARCFDLALGTVQEELDAQQLDTVIVDDRLTVPAWGMTVDVIAAEWLADGVATCCCHD